MKKDSKGSEAPFKNKLSENILDISKLIIPKGNLLLKLVEIKPLAGIILPESVDKSEYEYWVIFKLGDEDFAKNHPEFKFESSTKVGNVIISLTPQNTPLLTHGNDTYIQVHESAIKSQVTSSNFKIKK